MSRTEDAAAPRATDRLPIALDAMGGDRAPGEIVTGARRAVAELGVEVVLVGRPDAIDAVAPDLAGTAGITVAAAAEVIDMHDDPSQSVRRKKDSSLVRAAEAVRDGRASAMVSAGNTGATMASALLRMGRIKGVSRPAIATALPVPGAGPTILLDSGANSECQPAWLVQFAQMATVFAQERFHIATPRVGLLSIGEEDTKGTTLVRETNALLKDAAGVTFVGNVEGRDLLSDDVDVVITDGFTGNVALKTLEGGLKFLVDTLFAAMTATPEASEAAKVLVPQLAPVIAQLDPDSQGGAALLGVDGVCIISHGSSSATAIVNAVRVADEMVAADLVARLGDAVRAG